MVLHMLNSGADAAGTFPKNMCQCNPRIFKGTGRCKHGCSVCYC
jgi:hypothetical protein